MSRNSNWEADKMLDVYIHDYFVKRNLHSTARAFQAESRVSRDPVAINAPGGFLLEWWSVFWDMYSARTSEKHPESAASPVSLPQHQSSASQQHGKRNQQVPKQKRSSDHQLAKGTADVSNSKSTSLKRQRTASANALATKSHEERLNLSLPMDLCFPSNNLSKLLEPYQLQMMKSAAVGDQSSGQTMQSFSGSSSRNLDQAYKKHVGIRDLMSSVAPNRAVLDQGGSNFPFKGWPITAPDQLYSGLFTQRTSLSQMQLQQRFMLQAQQTKFSSFSDLEAHTLRMLLSSNSSMNHHLSHALPNDGPLLQCGSGDMDQLLAHLLNSNQQQNLNLQHSPLRQAPMYPNYHLQQEKFITYGIMNADASYSNASVGIDQAAESEIGPTVEQPFPLASPSVSYDTAHTPEPTSNHVSTLSPRQLRHATPVTSMSSPTYAAEARNVIRLPTTTELAEMDHFADDGFYEENRGSPSSYENVITSTKVGLDDLRKGSKGVSLEEIYHLRQGEIRVECCDYSSDGKFLITGGYDKKATLWCTKSFSLVSTLEEHSTWITDARFSPKMPRLSTSSVDKTVKIWDVDQLNYSIRTFTGHSSSVVSLDFHPSRDDLVCSSDHDNEIRYWSIKSGFCSGVLKGGANYIRFQPWLGRFLGAAVENAVSLIDVESQVYLRKLQGHQCKVHKVCWDPRGELLASVSDDLVRVWAIGSNAKGELVNEFPTKGKKFCSCVFHPTQPSVLIIGTHRTLELWDIKENKQISVQAHENAIACLAATNACGGGLIASGSYDKSVKIWK